MESLLNMGKKLFKDKMKSDSNDGSGGNSHGNYEAEGAHRDDESHGGNGSGSSNFLSKLKAFDRDGDGKITENGQA